VIEIRRGIDRTVTYGPGVATWHSFSFGAHYDPANLSFGRLVAHDLHVVAPGAGFEEHLHRALEIVSWVLFGTLLHEESSGQQRATVRHGTVQHLSAGSGVEHSERNGGAGELRFVQMWLLGEPGRPDYHNGENAIQLNGARFDVLRLDGDIRLPGAPFVHVYVADGAVEIAGAILAAGDAARIRDEAARAAGKAELLVWEMDGDERSREEPRRRHAAAPEARAEPRLPPERSE
jgi:quercetin 2,3-dioxygenase